FWDMKQSALTPVCRLEPHSAEDVSFALQVLTHYQCPFSVKSGGHATMPLASNMENGVTIDLGQMSQVKLFPATASTQAHATVGAGAIWFHIFRALEPFGMTVVGGRNANVGVGGLALGGGFSFFSTMEGLSCDNILWVEIVLANGTITYADEQYNTDLLRALRGVGGGNFGVVTKLAFKAIPLPNKNGLWSMTAFYTWDKINAQIASLNHLVRVRLGVEYKSASTINTWIYTNMTGRLLYALHTDTTYPDPTHVPFIFGQLTRIPAVNGTVKQAIIPQSDLISQVAATDSVNRRNSFATFTYRPVESLQFEHDLVNFFEEAVAELEHIPGVFVTFVFQPLVKDSMRAENSMGFLPGEKSLIVFEWFVVWDNESDDETIFRVEKDIVTRASELAKSMGQYHPLKYINYAELWQKEDVWAGLEYAGKLDKLRDVQRKYDPHGVFIENGLSTGYFKLN
ncbi:FAD-binding domain-containing protein, partial [Aulographum hederae CBS 113979]